MTCLVYLPRYPDTSTLRAWRILFVLARASDPTPPAYRQSSSRRAWQLACVPGVEGHACPCVSRCKCGHGEHAARKSQARASNQAKHECMQHVKTSTARRAGGHVHVNPRLGRRPSSICSQKGERTGCSARCQGPYLVLPSRCAATSAAFHRRSCSPR